MANQYLPVLVIVAVSMAIAAVMLALNHILGPKRSATDPQLPDSRWVPFECGTHPIQGDNRRRVSIKFYLIAVLFVLFDLEVVLLYPWAVVAKDLGVFGFVELVLFMVSLLVGLVYAWKKGALEWR